MAGALPLLVLVGVSVMSDSPLERFIKMFRLDDIPLNRTGDRYSLRMSENVEDRRKSRSEMSLEELAQAEAGDLQFRGILGSMDRDMGARGRPLDLSRVPTLDLSPWEQADPFSQEMSARLRNPREMAALEQRDASGNLTAESIGNLMKGCRAIGR
jgi:hypothetical protein